jgi:hypothetical protein
MKITTKLLLLGVTAGASVLLFAQDAPNNNQGAGPQDGPGPGGPGGGHHRMRHPPIALIGAIDANHDGVIDADEIANAVEALKKLDKNGDGKLTPDEFLGMPPGGPEGGPQQPGPDGQSGPRGPRGPRPDGQSGPGDRQQ